MWPHAVSFQALKSELRNEQLMEQFFTFRFEIILAHIIEQLLSRGTPSNEKIVIPSSRRRTKRWKLTYREMIISDYRIP